MEKSLSTLIIQSFRRRNLSTKESNDDYSSPLALTSRNIKNGGTTLISIISAPPISCYQPTILLAAKDSVEIQVLFSSASKIIPTSSVKRSITDEDATLSLKKPSCGTYCLCFVQHSRKSSARQVVKLEISDLKTSS